MNLCIGPRTQLFRHGSLTCTADLLNGVILYRLYPIVISRFLLDLRQIGDIVDDDDRLSTTIAFNHMPSSNEHTSFLDGIHKSMGGPLHGLFDRIVEMDSPHEDQVENTPTSATYEDIDQSTSIISREVEVVR